MSDDVECTLGTDPEFFLRCMKEKRHVSAIPHIKGSKHEPEQMECGGTIQRDNVALEVATVPAKGREDFVKRIKDCLIDAHKRLPDHLEIVVEPSATFDQDQLDHPEACEFGCDPDFNAYTVAINEPPWVGDSGFRSCGAHIHVGGLDDNGKPIAGLEFLQEFQGKFRGVKAMDLVPGLISTILDNSEAAIKRRELYGKAGCHRPTDYGFEYRVLSNYWIKSPELVMLMDCLTRDAMKIASSNKLDEILAIVGEDDLQNIINEGKVEDAISIVEKYIKPLLSVESLDLFAMCSEKISTYKSLKEEWGI